jgi:hypothetical protein
VDSIGAQHLAARLRARASVGKKVVLDQDVPDSGLWAGDCGVVREITPDGVTIEWDRGFSLCVDPDATAYQPLD